MLVGVIILGIVGIVCTVLGYLIWKKQKISLLHDYHYDKVSEENKPAFCKLSGIGVTLVGLGIFVTAVFIGITNSVWSFLAFIVGFVAGITLLIYSGRKYNR